jgi:hypothetical protein
MPPLRTLLVAAAALACGGCMMLPIQTAQPGQSAGASDPGAPGAPAAGGMEAPGESPGGGAGPEAAPSKPVPTTVEVKSECSKTVPVFYGEKPKFGSGTRSTVSGNSTSSAGRKADGTLMVWIIDEQENGVASAQVTPDTRRVVIDRSCTAIRAE